MNLFKTKADIFAQNEQTKKWEIIKKNSITIPRSHQGNICRLKIN